MTWSIIITKSIMLIAIASIYIVKLTALLGCLNLLLDLQLHTRLLSPVVAIT